MGIIKKGINGPFKGKAGSVVGSSWKKIDYIKGLQRKKAPSVRPPLNRLSSNNGLNCLPNFSSRFRNF
ncbi:hypothetical protein [Parapedobacter sp. 2B3]|uniref:hypothetical protein n=1 Tax=Parapedobacter sp. 2B3 TaxID=3342381 RepID=UPI0035B62055